MWSRPAPALVSQQAPQAVQQAALGTTRAGASRKATRATDVRPRIIYASNLRMGSVSSSTRRWRSTPSRRGRAGFGESFSSAKARQAKIEIGLTPSLPIAFGCEASHGRHFDCRADMRWTMHAAAAHRYRPKTTVTGSLLGLGGATRRPDGALCASGLPMSRDPSRPLTSTNSPGFDQIPKRQLDGTTGVSLHQLPATTCAAAPLATALSVVNAPARAQPEAIGTTTIRLAARMWRRMGAPDGDSRASRTPSAKQRIVGAAYQRRHHGRRGGGCAAVTVGAAVAMAAPNACANAVVL